MAPSFVFGALQPIASLVSRDETPDQANQKKLTPTLIGGIVIAAVLAVGAAVALLFRFFRKRASSKRETERGTAFLNVRGLVREDDQKRCVCAPALVFLQPLTRRVTASASRCRAAASSRASR